MYNEIESTLDKIDTISIIDETYLDLPDLFWMEGLFGIMSTTSNTQTSYFYSASEKENSNFLCLTTNDVYFASGYDQLLSQAEGFSDHFIIQARMLIKSLGNNKHFTMASPMVVKKIGNWKFK